MKRCRQCDFIYENDQSLCDMDGRELVSVDGALTLEQNAGRQIVEPVKSRWRISSILPIFGVIFGVNLGVVLFLAYDVFSHQTSSQKTSYLSVKAAAELQPAPNPVMAAPVAKVVASPIKSQKFKVKATDTIPTVVRLSPKPVRSPAPRQEERKLKPEDANPRKESKIVSFFKKTGRILKKPFKF